MGVNFSPFEIGRRALRASQLGLTVTGQNIANVNTPGYSRQSVQLSASPTDTSTRTRVGTGVTVDGVRSFRDRFVDSRLQTETGITGRLTAQRDALAPVEAALNATGGGGIGSAMNSFFAAFGDLEAHPGSATLRESVVQRGNSLATAFQSTRQRLTDIRSDTDANIRATVENANKLAGDVASLNARIASAEAMGANASELRDQRAEALNQLAEATGARSVENPDGMVTVTLADGRALVAGAHHSSLQAVSTPPDGLAALMLDGQPAAIGDGALRGLLDAVGAIGAQLTSLDDLASSIAVRVNELHTSGTDLNGNAGVNFFAAPANGAAVNASNLSVNAALKADPRLVVASPLVNGPTGTVAGSIANLLTDSNSHAGTRSGSFSSIHSTIVSDAGRGVSEAESALSMQQAILAQTTAQRDSVAGVSLDEEAINMLQFQKAYEAAARFLKIADDMSQTIMSIIQ